MHIFPIPSPLLILCVCTCMYIINYIKGWFTLSPRRQMGVCVCVWLLLMSWCIRGFRVCVGLSSYHGFFGVLEVRVPANAHDHLMDVPIPEAGPAIVDTSADVCWEVFHHRRREICCGIGQRQTVNHTVMKTAWGLTLIGQQRAACGNIKVDHNEQSPFPVPLLQSVHVCTDAL